MAQVITVATESAERVAMSAIWSMIADIRSGASAVRAKGKDYLPKFEDETEEEHKRRVASAPWRPEFNDALAALIARPFTRDIALDGEASPTMESIFENADQRGNNLTIFAKSLFENALADGWSAVLVDYPVMEDVKTRAEEIASGARPYLCQIRGSDVIALYTRFEAGQEVVDHMRIRETETVRDGFGEKVVKRIRVLEPGLWQLWEEVRNSDNKVEWVMVQEGALRRGNMTSVPVAFLRTGNMAGTIKVTPPLADLAHMQIELYRAMSRKDEVMVYSASPMLKVIGAAAPDQPLKTGPRRAIFVPPGEGNADVDYLVPPAANIKEIRDDIESIINDMRRIGMQPMIQKANISSVGTITDAAKAHSVLQSWATALKDTLETALQFAAEYVGEAEGPSVAVHTDFAAGQGGDAELTALKDARKSGDLSRHTLWEEYTRRGVLGPQFEADDEDERLASEGEPIAPEVEIDPITGQPVDQSTED